MVDKNDQLNEILNLLNLSAEETEVYRTLFSTNPLTILELSRRAKLPRTTLYRQLDKMKEAGLIEEIVDSYKTKVQAVSLDRLELLLKTKEQNIHAALDKIPNIKETFNAITSLHQPGTKVVFYRGVEGIKQILWNELRAEKLIQSYSFQNVQEITGDKFMANWNQEWLATKIKIRDLVSDRYLKNRLTTRHFGIWNNIERRYLPAKKLDINTCVDIYNDVIVYFNWQENDIFGVEIHNQEIADLQKQIHHHLWQEATPMTKTISSENRGMPIANAGASGRKPPLYLKTFPQSLKLQPKVFDQFRVKNYHC